MDSALTPKDVVIRFLELMGTGQWDDMEKAGALLADDVDFWIAGNTAISGTVVGREAAMERRFRPARKRTMPGTLTLRIGKVIPEGDYVAAEWTSRRKVFSSADYENFLFGLFHIRNGKISSLREYLDTQAVVQSSWRHIDKPAEVPK